MVKNIFTKFFDYIQKNAVKSNGLLPESASGSAFVFLAKERERERVRHFEKRANALENTWNQYRELLLSACFSTLLKE